MKKILIPVLLLSVLAMFFGCSKDKDVQDLENEVMESESQDYLADTTSAQPVETTADTSAKDYAMKPETAPVEETPAETRMPAQSGSGSFAIQVAAGTNPEYARALAERYVERGYDAFVTETIYNGETYYRIRLGGYDTYDEAETAGLNIKDKYSADFWIDNNY